MSVGFQGDRTLGGAAACLASAIPASQRIEHRSGITETLRWHRTPAMGAWIFLFLQVFNVLSLLMV